MVPHGLLLIAGAGYLSEGGAAPKGFMDGLPDPMKVDPATLAFVVVLVTLLYLFLKFAFFKPIIRVMDDREQAIQSGSARRSEAAALVEERQGAYAAKLKELRGQAFEHRKALAAAAAQERQAILERARTESGTHRDQALAELQTAKESAKTDLVAQVESLSESMVSHLLRQA